MNNFQGLLGNPMFTGGMSLLGASRDKRNDPFAAVMSGMQMSNQYNNQQQLLQQRADKNKLQQQAHEQKQAEYQKQQELEARKAQYLASLQDNPNLNQDKVAAVQAGVMNGSELFKAPPKRGTIKGADGYNYWADNPTERVNPNITASSVNKAPGYGLTPFFGTNAEGEILPYQLSNQGGAAPVELPEGVTAFTPYQKAMQTSQGGAEGKVKGEKLAGIEDRLGEIDTMLSTVESLSANPNVNEVYGSIEGRLPSMKQETIDAESSVDLLMNQITLDKREKLKGSGQISDFESKMLGKAATKLQNKLISDEEKDLELTRIKDILTSAKMRALQMAGKPVDSGGWGIEE